MHLGRFGLLQVAAAGVRGERDADRARHNKQCRQDEGERTPPPRYPWNRSMRDEPYRPGSGKLSPVEAVFVGTAVVASIAMLIWFFAFAGSPLPT